MRLRAKPLPALCGIVLAGSIAAGAVEANERMLRPVRRPKSQLAPEAAPTSLDAPAACATGACASGKYGTQIEFQSSAEEASKLAAAQGKMVFVLQLSGNFAREEFT